LDKSGVDKQELKYNCKYHKGSGFKDGNSNKTNNINNHSKQMKKRGSEGYKIQCMNCLKWGSHTAKECNALKAFKANYADDSCRGRKSSKQVSVDAQSEEEEKYENDAMYTDCFVKKRQLSMNVTHFASPIAESSGDIIARPLNMRRTLHRQNAVMESQ
jgi:hypothetical protein